MTPAVPETVTVVVYSAAGRETRVEVHMTATLGEEGIDWIAGACLADSLEAQALLAANLLVREPIGATGAVGVQGPTGSIGPIGRQLPVTPPWVQKEQKRHHMQLQRMDARGCR